MKELKNFSTVRKCTKGVKVKHENLLPEHQLTRLAERELMSLQGVVSMELYGILSYHVRGFDEEMQITMAENLVDFAKQHVAYTTGVASADLVLDICYKMIAMEMGLLKKSVLSRMKNNGSLR
ncbi:MAG: hypothetical protein IJ929_05145, partial [Prevotella sp.]|nr:hypothetical protein [Prevotella sp.]